MASKDREEIKAFAQKMHDEGAAGFASGLAPWETWDDFEGRVGSRVWQGTSERVADRERPSRNFGDRVLTAMTALAVAALAIGITGVYMTQESAQQVANNRVQRPSASPAITPATHPPRQGPAIESREENVAVNTWIPATATPASPVAESRMMMDTAAALSAAPSVNQGSDALLPSTPAMDTAAAPSAAPSVNQDSDTPLPSTPADDNGMLATLDKRPVGAAIPVTTSMGSDTAAPEPGTDKQLTLAALNDLPAPAAGLPAAAVDGMADDRPAADMPSMPSEPAPESAGYSKPEKPATVTTGPGNSAPTQPVHPPGLTLLDVQTEPLAAPDQDINHGEKAGHTGDWSINIASYLKQQTAEKMRTRFLDKGVATDMVTALVNGKTYYRLRVTGFESKAAARTQSTTIKEKLGLKETWITKQ